MADTVREQIIAGIATDLATITTTNGYENTVVNVQRFMQSGLSVADVPCVIVNFDEERKNQGPSDRAECDLRVTVDVWAVHDEDSVSGYTASLVDSLAGDVEKAIMSDTTRDGFARGCEIESVIPFRLAEGQPFVGATVSVKITYTHDISNPYTARA